MVDDAVERMREAGRKYLRKHPKAFGGGIDPRTGIRYVGGKRVSVTTPEEEKAGIPKITPPKPKPIIPTIKPTIRRTYLSPTKFQTIRPPTGIGKFTRAVDVGGGKMQDFLFSYSRGRIIKEQPIGKIFPQTQRFKEREKIEKEKRIKILGLTVEKPKFPKLTVEKPKFPKLTVEKPKFPKIPKRVTKALDFISGGYLTERKIDKDQEKLNKDIDDFNKKFGNKELTEAQFNQAKSISTSIEKRETSLKKERDELAQSLKSKIAGTLAPLEKRKTSEEIKAEIKRNQPRIKKEKSQIKKYEDLIKKESKKKGFVARINLKRLKAVKIGIEERIKKLEDPTIPVKMFAGTMPIIPVIGIPSGVTNIQFLGIQKVKGNKILTDLVFRTSKGRVGIAKGVTISKGKESASVVLGRSGKVTFKFPSAKKKIIDVRSFIGKEKAITIPSKLILKTKIDLLAKSHKIGTVTRVNKNIEILKQAGIGRTATVKGIKFMKAGKVVKGISKSDFASISAILTKKELSLIIGESITNIGAKARFIGLIKGVSQKGKVFSIGDKQQFAKGLQQVISATSSALAKAQKVGKLPKAISLITASRIAVAKAKAKAKPTPITKLKVKPKITPQITKPKITPQKITITKVKAKARVRGKVKPITKQITKPKLATPITKQITKQKAKVIQKQKQKLIQGAKQLQKQRAIQKQKLKQSITQRQRLRLKQAMRQTQKQINKIAQRLQIIKSGIVPPKIPRIPLPIKIKFKKKRKKTISKKKIKKQAYNVYARPRKKIKKGRRPRLIKVNKVPLKKSTAKNLRNYITDTSLSRTARIRKTKGKPKTSRLRIPSGYAKRTSKKFRRYKIIKGKRKLLPKGAVIEKRKYLLDTKREKRQITLRRRITQITKPKIKRTVRKVSGIKRSPTIKKSIRKPVRRSKQPTRPVNSQNRAFMLKNLERARKIRMSNLKKKKR